MYNINNQHSHSHSMCPAGKNDFKLLHFILLWKRHDTKNVFRKLGTRTRSSGRTQYAHGRRLTTGSEKPNAANECACACVRVCFICACMRVPAADICPFAPRPLPLQPPHPGPYHHHHSINPSPSRCTILSPSPPPTTKILRIRSFSSPSAILQAVPAQRNSPSQLSCRRRRRICHENSSRSRRRRWRVNTVNDVHVAHSATILPWHTLPGA